MGAYLESMQSLPDYTLLGEYSGTAEPASWSFFEEVGDANFDLVVNSMTTRQILLVGAPFCNMARFISGGRPAVLSRRHQ